MIETGTILQNRYRLERRVGQGGMGAVFLAWDERFGSKVAVKQTLFDDANLRKAFEREAHLLNRLRHGALPKVSDHFVEGDGQFLVMEFIEGSDLSELLEKRGAPFGAREVLAWGDELLDALDYLHTQEPPVIHRDIKPQNLKLTEPGHEVVLLDFGLAKGTPAHASATSATASVFGYSRNYAALEQIQGAGTDARSDLYSLAATLYHLLTNVAPADALTRASAAVNNQPDPLLPAHRVRADVPPAVGLALHRAMALKATLRPATAAEMRAALRQAANLLADAQPSSHAAGVYPPSQQTSSHSTLIEPTAARDHAAQYHHSTVVRDTTQVRPPASRWGVGEATMVDHFGAATRHPSAGYAHAQQSYAHAGDELTAGRSRAKVIGVAVAAVLALVVVAAGVFAAVGYTFSQRPVAERQSDAAAGSQDSTDEGTDAQADGTQTTPDGEAQAADNAATDQNPATQPSPGDNAAQQSAAQPSQAGAAGGASAAATTPSAAGASEELNASDIGASSGSGGLSIQRPLPSNFPAEEEEPERRAEATKPAPTPEQQRRAEREVHYVPVPTFGGGQQQQPTFGGYPSSSTRSGGSTRVGGGGPARGGPPPPRAGGPRRH